MIRPVHRTGSEKRRRWAAICACAIDWLALSAHNGAAAITRPNFVTLLIQLPHIDDDWTSP